jgi:short subunit dehydrogenase-like uncharacterized protein
MQPTKRDRLLIYGASGYSGRLVTRRAVELGLQPVLCGRDPISITALADELGCEPRVASLRDTVALDRALHDVAVVLHTAGPFSATAAPMLEACLRAGADYLDLTGETAVVESLAAANRRARERGIMIMPGVGLDVVAGDCLALHAVSRLSRPSRLAIGVHGLRLTSRGTAKTIVEAAGGGYARRGGRLVPVTLGSIEKRFDFGWGPTTCLNVYWADVSTAYYTTGVPDIDVFCEATSLLRLLAVSNRYFGRVLATAPWQAWVKGHLDVLVDGPTEQQRGEARAVFVAEAVDASGRRSITRLCAPEAYTFTAMAAPAIAAIALEGDREPGFQTPARVYGPDLPLRFDGVVREDLL